MLRSKYIRLFVSSTFEDMIVERDILQKRVFPRISQLCEELGWQFEDIDLRWGVSQEASRMQKTMQICLNEIRNCQKLSPKPNFLILQGDRYGWIPIPEIIPSSEAEELLRTLNKNDRELFERWYVLDENACGGEYILRSRDGRYLDYDTYAKEAEDPLREIFKRFSTRLKDVDRKRFYYASATEKEILAGLNGSEDAREHVMLYSRHITDVPSKLQSVYDDNPKTLLNLLSGNSRLKTLRQELLALVKNKVEKTLSYDTLRSEEYAKVFEEDIYRMLEQLVLKEVNTYAGVSEIESEREKNQIFVRNRTSFFIGRNSFVEDISACISNGISRPMVLTGESGCGKSSVMAKIVADHSQKMNVIARFVGHTFTKSFGKDLLQSIWTEMDLYSSTQLEFSVMNFGVRLAESSVEKPLLIVIDGLDQLQLGPGGEEISRWMWLPDELAANVHILLSVVTSSDGYAWRLKPGFGVFKLSGMAEEDACTFVDKRLSFMSRKLTAGQSEIIRKAVAASSRQPIYLTLLSHYASRLHSFDAIEPTSLKDSSSLFENFLDELASSDHGYEIVKNIIALIVFSRYGVSQNEIREMLPVDEKFWAYLTGSSHYEINPRLVPSVLIIRLLNDLGDFIYQQSAFDKVLITFSHKILYSFATDWLYKKEVDSEYCYRLMFFYFNQKWRMGDLHAIYEMPSKALYAKSVKLFMDLDYCIMKIWKGASDDLRVMANLIMHFCGENFKKQLFDFMKFDAEASAYVKDNECGSSYREVREAVLGLAANWAKDSIVRFSFDNTPGTYPSMINTIGPKGYDDRLFVSLPFIVNESAVIDDDGNKIIWLEHKQLCTYFQSTSVKQYLLPEYKVDDFKVSADFKTVVARAGKSILVHDVAVNGKTRRYDLNGYCSEFLDFNIHVKENKDLVIAFHDNQTLYVVWPKSETECTLRRLSIAKYHSPKLIGFLNDGEWIVMETELAVAENGEDLLYKDLNAYDLVALNYKGGVRHKVSYKTKYSSKTLYRNVVSSASGHDMLVSSSSNYIAVCDYSESEMKFRNIPIFNSWGRGHTYGLHISADDSTFWAISGDMRLIQFDLKNDAVRYVINMPVEGVEFRASSGNNYLLISTTMEYPYESSNYDSVLNTSAFESSVDYFPSLLTTISADARGRRIFTSHGCDPQTNAEGAVMFNVSESENGMLRMEYNDPNTMDRFFAMSTAVSLDGTRTVYAKGTLVEHVESGKVNYYHIPPRKEPVEIRFPNRDVWSFINRIEYTPDNSAFLALSGLANLGESSQDGYLFVTSDGDEGFLKHVIELPKDKKFYSFTCSNISNNGAYALVWSGNHFLADYMGLLIDLRKNQIISRLDSVFDMKFFPDSIGTIETGISKYVPAQKLRGPALFGFRVGITYMLDSQSPLYRYQNTALGDISPSGRFASFIDYSVKKGSRVFTSLYKGELLFDEYVNACLITHDDLHMFVICETVIYLVQVIEMKLVQEFRMNYPNDKKSRANSFLFVSQHIDNRYMDGKAEHVHNSRHFQLYDKGLIISDWDHIFRIEPDGYKINEVSFATISRVWNHRKDEFDEPKALCPMCGKRFAPDGKVLKCIEDICKGLPQDASPCLNLKFGEWERPELKGHTCPHCGNQLRFNPFIG